MVDPAAGALHGRRRYALPQGVDRGIDWLLLEHEVVAFLYIVERAAPVAMLVDHRQQQLPVLSHLLVELRHLNQPGWRHGGG